MSNFFIEHVREVAQTSNFFIEHVYEHSHKPTCHNYDKWKAGYRWKSCHCDLMPTKFYKLKRWIIDETGNFIGITVSIHGSRENAEYALKKRQQREDARREAHENFLKTIKITETIQKTCDNILNHQDTAQ